MTSYHDIPALLRASGELTASDIAARMQIDTDDTLHLLSQHLKAGEIERLCRGTGRPPVYAAMGAPVLTAKTNGQTRAKPVQIKAPRRRAFSPVNLHGFHAKADGTVTLFLDRRLSASSITFTADQLRKMAADAERAAV
ncbi:hypothetical protein [Laribacter hongkongensis]|uniref:hypothetical protein n=1 Tax=Laribacter hongkongensis TaxID=168471 RepID=UPI001EFD8F94|nr:hypothetical protein [Laribacter hongkongensis]MCG9081131.1 hypothetical protein [Laribacter hongkongensis]